MRKRSTRLFVRNWLQVILIIGAIALLVIYLSEFLVLLNRLFFVLRPIIFGSLIALILNILLVKVEALYFPNSKRTLVRKSRRIVSILISVLLVLAVISLIIGLVVPQLFQSINIIANGLPKTYNDFLSWVETSDALPEALRERILTSDFDIGSLISQFASEAEDWVGDAVALAGRIVSEVVDLIFSLIFALYILANKEKLMSQLKRVAYAYLPNKINISLSHILFVAYDNFVSFFGGQILSALVLGVLTAIGMVILRLPFVPVVASVVGITALIPILGAYIGNFVGVVLILTVSPFKALVFFVFLIVLQQIEGNLIYPKIVGDRVGLPAYWVLIAVILGGGFGGVFGILIAVPIVATIHYLFKEDVDARIQRKPAGGISKIMVAAREPLYNRQEMVDRLFVEDAAVDDLPISSTVENDQSIDNATMVDESIESTVENDQSAVSTAKDDQSIESTTKYDPIVESTTIEIQDEEYETKAPTDEESKS